MRRSIFTFLLLAVPCLAQASPPKKEAASAPAPAPKVKFKKGKDVDFEALVIQGQLKRPEIAVVTGDGGQGTDGLLRLRENFADRMAIDFGEEAK
jgi:hypothetical protein